MSENNTSEAIPITEWPPLEILELVDAKRPVQDNNKIFIKSHHVNEERYNADHTPRKRIKSSFKADFNTSNTDVNIHVLATMAVNNCWNAELAIVRWWKRINDKKITKMPSNNKHQLEYSPEAMLTWLATLPDCIEFVQLCISLLEERCSIYKDSAKVLICLSSYYEIQKADEEALSSLARAAKLIELPEETLWFMERIKRNVHIKNKQMKLLKTCRCGSSVFDMEPESVDTCIGSKLSSKDFYENYVLKGKPLVFKNLSHEMVDKLWEFSHLDEIIGKKSCKLKTHSPTSTNWAKLVDKSSESNIGQFLKNTFESNKQTDSYLFDWSIPLNAPELLKDLLIPKYFYNDFLQRTSEDSLYKNSWPSLFIAPSSMISDLHVDAFTSNFWMALFHGRKRWTFFAREDFSKLYPRYHNGLDASFEVDLLNPDYIKFPLLKYAQPKQCVLEAGDVLFVPFGSPHFVENIESSIAISSNFVDCSNYDNVLSELDAISLVNPLAKDLHLQLKSKTFVKEMLYADNHVKWKMYKKQNYINVCHTDSNNT